MKLQPKKTVAVQVATERRQQIDEGVSIAKKVDALRENFAQLQFQQRKFVESSRLELERQTSGLTEEIASKRRELLELAEEKKLLLAPLDEAWRDVKEKRKEVQKRLTQIAQKEKGLAVSISKAEADRQEAKSALSNIKVRERELAKAYTEADSLRAEAEATNAEAKSNKEKSVEKLEQKWEELEKIQAKNQFDAEANLNQKALLDLIEKELNDKDRAVNDKYQTLLRTQERIKNG